MNRKIEFKKYIKFIVAIITLVVIRMGNTIS